MARTFSWRLRGKIGTRPVGAMRSARRAGCGGRGSEGRIKASSPAARDPATPRDSDHSRRYSPVVL